MPVRVPIQTGPDTYTMKQYELLYIIASPYTDEEVEQIQGTVEKLLTKQGGEVSRNESLGKIKLAYPIKKEKYGTYVLVHFKTEPENISQIERILGLTDEVLRHMVMALPAGAEEREYDITGYVPPLSPKGVSRREEKKDSDSGKSSSKSSKSKSSKSSDSGKKKPKQADKPKKEDKKEEEEDEKLTMEELDERLDEILDSDLGSV
jgi:small subunit ribosomal protein S6